MAIYAIGDPHGRLRENLSCAQGILNDDDILLIAGDVKLMFFDTAEYKDELEWISTRPWTTLFVDGNHENYRWLYSLPVVDKFGDKTHMIADNVYHLMRGGIFELPFNRTNSDKNTLSLLAMGGAISPRKEGYTEGYDWYPEELPNEDELKKCLENIRTYNDRVDIVLTHDCPSFLHDRINPDFKTDYYSDWLDLLSQWLDYDNWLFGHYHEQIVSGRFMCLFHNLIRIA